MMMGYRKVEGTKHIDDAFFASNELYEIMYGQNDFNICMGHLVGLFNQIPSQTQNVSQFAILNNWYLIMFWSNFVIICKILQRQILQKKGTGNGLFYVGH